MKFITDYRSVDALFCLIRAGLQSLIVSDEDEFHEDDILRDLRQRRSVFVRLLQQLDDELAARNDVQNNPPNPVDEQS